MVAFLAYVFLLVDAGYEILPTLYIQKTGPIYSNENKSYPNPSQLKNKKSIFKMGSSLYTLEVRPRSWPRIHRGQRCGIELLETRNAVEGHVVVFWGSRATGGVDFIQIYLDVKYPKQRNTGLKRNWMIQVI